ncbi:MAG: hypothetical protein RL265_1403 [Bacteroidota bacterium]
MSEQSASTKNTKHLSFSEIPGLLKEAIVEFFQRDGLFHGAALAYYTLFAMVPLFYLSISVIGRFIGQDVMLEIISDLLQNKIGIQDVKGIMDFMKELDFEKGNFFLESVSIIALLVASSAFVVCLKGSLNEFLGIQLQYSSKRKQVLSTLLFRILSVGYIGVITVFIILLYFVQTIVLTISSSIFENSAFFGEILTGIVQHGFGIFSNVVIFSLVFKYVHNGFVPWKLAFGGAVLTSVLLYLGQLLIQYYLFHFFFMANGRVTLFRAITNPVLPFSFFLHGKWRFCRIVVYHSSLGVLFLTHYLFWCKIHRSLCQKNRKANTISGMIFRF